MITCPCYLHRTPPMDGCPCICECDHELSDSNKDQDSGVNAGPAERPDGTDEVPDEAKGYPPCPAVPSPERASSPGTSTGGDAR